MPFTSALKSIPSFLPGYIKLAEGEKDPRNLLLAFNIAKVITLEFDITSHIDVSLIPIRVSSSQLDNVTGHVRYNILLLPYHIQTSTQ
jgi:hypothetical protein